MIKERLRAKDGSVGCQLCHFGSVPDGPRGHLINGVWTLCALQARPECRAVIEEYRPITLPTHIENLCHA